MATIAVDIGIVNYACCVWDAEDKIVYWGVWDLSGGRDGVKCSLAPVVHELRALHRTHLSDFKFHTILIESQMSDRMRSVEYATDMMLALGNPHATVHHVHASNKLKGSRITTSHTDRKHLAVDLCNEYVREETPYAQSVWASACTKRDDLSDAYLHGRVWLRARKGIMPAHTVAPTATRRRRAPPSNPATGCAAASPVATRTAPGT